MSGYTDAIWDYSTDGLRQVMFPAGALHLSGDEPVVFRLGFTSCGRLIPRYALIDEEIPERFQPPKCQRCAEWLENHAQEKLYEEVGLTDE
jgi:hypothetical protein